MPKSEVFSILKIVFNFYATLQGPFSTSVELVIKILDVNDNAPKFEMPHYQVNVKNKAKRLSP